MLLKERPHTAPVTEEAIAQRAYTLWQSRGCPVGDGQEDWQDAKAQLLVETAHQPRPLQRLLARLRNRAAVS